MSWPRENLDRDYTQRALIHSVESICFTSAMRLGFPLVGLLVFSSLARAAEPQARLTLTKTGLKAGQFFYTVVEEAAPGQPQLVPDCRPLVDADLGKLKSTSLSCDASFKTPAGLRATRCVATEDRQVFLIFASRKMCSKDREAALSSEE